jgi:ABC-2 type transport system permease protein
MNKYRQAFLVGLQGSLVYRWTFAVRSAFSLVQLLVVFILWGAVYAGSPSVGGFAFGQTLTYFVLLVVLQFFTSAFNEDYQISEEIRNGLINQFLLKPIDYFLYRLSIFCSARVVSGAIVVAPMAAAVFLLRGRLVLPHDAWRIAFGLPALAMSAFIQFSIAYCFGMLTFWLLEIQGFVILSMAVESILGGQLFPLDLLPAGFFRAAQLLPFYYQTYFPAAILSGRIGRDLAWQGLALQLFWTLALFGLSRLLWRQGLARYTAVGG